MPLFELEARPGIVPGPTVVTGGDSRSMSAVSVLEAPWSQPESTANVRWTGARGCSHFPCGTRPKGALYRTLKRTLDVVSRSFVLVILAPLLAVAAAAIRLTSRGPILYAQDRAGYRGKAFRLYKLRTMVRGADQRVDEVAHLNSRQWPDFKVERRSPRHTGRAGIAGVQHRRASPTLQRAPRTDVIRRSAADVTDAR